MCVAFIVRIFSPQKYETNCFERKEIAKEEEEEEKRRWNFTCSGFNIDNDTTFDIIVELVVLCCMCERNGLKFIMWSIKLLHPISAFGGQ